MASRFFRPANLVSSIGAYWAPMLATLPVVIWTHDSFYTCCRVRGSSMNPTLQNGDIVLVRRSDNLWQTTLESYHNRGEDGDVNDNLKRRQEEREKVTQFEMKHCSQSVPIWPVRKPATPTTGDIVVFKDPAEYPAKWNIKRVIALGGQVLMMPSTRYDKRSNNNELRYRMDDDDTSMRLVTPSVPPYSIWVEGDNTANSIDSKDHGPVTKKLMMGVAEYVLWPPSRMGASLKSNVDASKQPRAYWP